MTRKDPTAKETWSTIDALVAYQEGRRDAHRQPTVTKDLNGAFVATALLAVAALAAYAWRPDALSLAVAASVALVAASWRRPSCTKDAGAGSMIARGSA